MDALAPPNAVRGGQDDVWRQHHAAASALAQCNDDGVALHRAVGEVSADQGAGRAAIQQRQNQQRQAVSHGSLYARTASADFGQGNSTMQVVSSRRSRRSRGLQMLSWLSLSVDGSNHDRTRRSLCPGVMRIGAQMFDSPALRGGIRPAGLTTDSSGHCRATFPELNRPAQQCKASRSFTSRHMPSMTLPTITPSQVRAALLLRDEIALLDVRHEAAFATGHPLFAANMAAGRIALEAGTRLPRKDVPIVLYDAGEGLVAQAADRLRGDGLYATFASSTAGCRPGRRRATNCSRTSIPTPRPSANWSSRAGIRPHCPRTKSPR